MKAEGKRGGAYGEPHRESRVDDWAEAARGGEAVAVVFGGDENAPHAAVLRHIGEAGGGGIV